MPYQKPFLHYDYGTKKYYVHKGLLSEAVYNCQVLKVSDLSEVPTGRFGWKGLVLLVNDHGNMTLYNHCKNGKVREIWSFV